MIFFLEAEILLHSLRIVALFLLCILFVNCSKSKGKGLEKKESKQVVNQPKTPKAPGGTTNTSSGKKEEEEDDVQFNLNIKPKEQKKDEFDDDEENPLAKIPTKPRLPKQKAVKQDTRSVDPECPIFAPNEKTNNSSCYMKPTTTSNTAISQIPPETQKL